MRHHRAPPSSSSSSSGGNGRRFAVPHLVCVAAFLCLLVFVAQSSFFAGRRPPFLRSRSPEIESSRAARSRLLISISPSSSLSDFFPFLFFFLGFFRRTGYGSRRRASSGLVRFSVRRATMRGWSPMPFFERSPFRISLNPRDRFEAVAVNISQLRLLSFGLGDVGRSVAFLLSGLGREFCPFLVDVAKLAVTCSLAFIARVRFALHMRNGF